MVRNRVNDVRHPEAPGIFTKAPGIFPTDKTVAREILRYA